jgi:hypothetical protein
VVAYWVVLDTYLGGILAAATVLFWRLSRGAPGALRIGLRCVAAGLALDFLYAAQKVVLVIAGAAAPTGTVERVFDGLRAVGALLAVGGALVPAVGWVRSLVRAYGSLYALRPLWQTMRRAYPDIILFPRRRALLELSGVDDVHVRLYRRVIEIRDGLLALREHLPADAGTEAGSFLAGRGAALAEACCIRLALYRKESGYPPAGDGRWASVGADLADEVRWMREVSGCLRRPEPARFVAWWAGREAVSPHR